MGEPAVTSSVTTGDDVGFERGWYGWEVRSWWVSIVLGDEVGGVLWDAFMELVAGFRCELEGWSFVVLVMIEIQWYFRGKVWYHRVAEFCWAVSEGTTILESVGVCIIVCAYNIAYLENGIRTWSYRAVYLKEWMTGDNTRITSRLLCNKGVT